MNTDFAARLNALQQQSRVTPVAANSRHGRVLQARIERMARTRHSQQQRYQQQRADLAAAVGGEAIGDGVIHRHWHATPQYRHGHGTLTLPSADDFRQLATLADDARPPARIAYLDTETSGLAGGTGTVVFQVGIAIQRTEDFCVHQYLISSYKAEREMLQRLAEQLEGCDHLVTFNGKAFDVPLLQTRYKLAGLADPFLSLAHTDLLFPTRRAFASRWADCRLQSAEKNLLGFRRHDDLPGSEAPLAWVDWLQRGDSRRLRGVLEHNRHDVISLAALLPLLAATHARPEDHAADATSIARFHANHGRTVTAYQILRRQPSLDKAGQTLLATQARRLGYWREAVELWEELAADYHIDALERLAKYYEHVEKDVHRALALTRQLRARDREDKNHRRREHRLLAKTQTDLLGTPMSGCS